MCQVNVDRTAHQKNHLMIVYVHLQLEVVSGCAEFCEIQLRQNEKKILNSLNIDKNKETIR